MTRNDANIYQHKVNKAEIPTCNILGVEIAAVNMNWMLDFTKEHIQELSGDYMCVSNVHTTVMSHDIPSYRKIQNNGIMAIPDGGPLSSYGRRHGFENMQRTTGPDYLLEILKISEEKGYRHFFYGSSQTTLEKLKKVLKKDYPDLEIAGMYSPPFRELSNEEKKEITEIINKADADFVWVGLGAPKQEKWMAEHQGKIKGFMIGVGAAFDYLAGNIARAPLWMQKCNMEWLYRLIQDPKRLFSRYFTTNLKYLWYVYILKKQK